MKRYYTIEIEIVKDILRGRITSNFVLHFSRDLLLHICNILLPLIQYMNCPSKYERLVSKRECPLDLDLGGWRHGSSWSSDMQDPILHSSIYLVLFNR